MNPLATFFSYLGIASAALSEPVPAGIAFGLAIVAQAAPAFLNRQR